MQRLNATKIANFHDALEYAFQQFDAVSFVNVSYSFQKLKEAVQKLNATRLANFHDALEYAFQQFDDVKFEQVVK